MAVAADDGLGHSFVPILLLARDLAAYHFSAAAVLESLLQEVAEYLAAHLAVVERIGAAVEGYDH